MEQVFNFYESTETYSPVLFVVVFLIVLGAVAQHFYLWYSRDRLEKEKFGRVYPKHQLFVNPAIYWTLTITATFGQQMSHCSLGYFFDGHAAMFSFIITHVIQQQTIAKNCRTNCNGMTIYWISGLSSAVFLISKEGLVLLDIQTDFFVAKTILATDTALGIVSFICLFVSNILPVAYAFKIGVYDKQVYGKNVAEASVQLGHKYGFAIRQFISGAKPSEKMEQQDEKAEKLIQNKGLRNRQQIMLYEAVLECSVQVVIQLTQALNKICGKDEEGEVRNSSDFTLIASITISISLMLIDFTTATIALCRQKAVLYSGSVNQDNREDVLAAVRHCGLDLQFMREEQKRDKEVVMQALKRHGFALKFASKELQGDKEVVMQAIKKYGESLKYASKKLREDKEVVIEAVKQYGGSLMQASKELKEDKDVVMQSIKKYGGSLQFASKKLQEDKEVVMEAVKQFGDSLMQASKEMQEDKDVVMEAVKQNVSSLEFASKELQEDKDVLALIPKETIDEQQVIVKSI